MITQFPQAEAGPSITNWTAWTPTGSWTANTTYSGFYRLVGEELEARVRLALTGAPTSTGLTINVAPTGYNIDTTKLPNGGATCMLGLADFNDTGTAFYSGYCAFSSNVNIIVYAALTNGTYLAPSQVTQAVPHTWANTDQMQLNFKFPWVAA